MMRTTEMIITLKLRIASKAIKEDLERLRSNDNVRGARIRCSRCISLPLQPILGKGKENLPKSKWGH